MGVVSVLGPAGSLVSLINATGALSKELYCLARGVRAARKDIRKFARKLSMFSWSSNEACACLLRHYSDETGLDTLSNAKKRRFLKRAEESAKEILKDVKNISPRILAMEPSGIELTLISKIKWYQRKSEVRDLTFEMGALQTSLALLMTTVTYEVQIRNGADPKTLARTMAQITNFIEGAEVMASKFEKLSNAQRAADKTLQSLSLLVENVIKVADKQLDDADEAREATRLYEPGRWVLRKEPAPTIHVFGSPKRPRMETHIQRARSGSPQPPLPPNKRMPIIIPTGSQGKGKERRTDRGPPEASSSRGMQDSLESNGLHSHNAGDIVGSKNVRSTQPPGTRFPHGADLKYCIAPAASDDYEEVNGQISKERSRNSKYLSRKITARVYPNFTLNAISRGFAKQLGLEVTALSDDFFVEMLSDIGSTQARVNDTVGEVRFVWHTPTHILDVLCTVFEQEIVPGVPLALGKPYVQQVETAGGVVRGESSRPGAAS
ncbi:hypothetical protein VF21_02770 [Pseudogymnoascus sp. 05NY08]|nr:hypothetical protein VF21_02770 [Pseudogymnoascus sp. 05NY08]